MSQPLNLPVSWHGCLGEDIASTYDQLWRWSVDDTDGFWRAIWVYFDVLADGHFEKAVSGPEMFKALWFEGVRTNYAEHLLRHEATAGADEVAFCHLSEIRPQATMTWRELGAQVRLLATWLREAGVEPGDRVVSYMPNVVETAVAMLASVAVGAVWSSAAPDAPTIRLARSAFHIIQPVVVKMKARSPGPKSE